MSIIKEPCNSQIISKELSLREVIRIIHNTKADLLFVCDEKLRLSGVVSQGDVNKFLSNIDVNNKLDAKVKNFYNANYKSLGEEFELSELNNLLSDFKVDLLILLVTNLL